MIPLFVLGLLAVLTSTGVECGYASAGSSSSSASDGSGHTHTQTNNNGHGQFSHTQTKPGGGVSQTSGNGVNGGNYGGGGGPSNNPGLYAPANFGQPQFGFNYGPSFPYGPFGANQPFNPVPQGGFGFNPTPFQPLQPFQPIQPIQPFQPFWNQPSQPSALATPQEFNQYLNNLQQQYAAGGSVAQSTPGATAFASSYLGPTKYYKQQQDQLNAWKNTPFQDGFGGAPNYAYASGAYGPNGVHQTAGVFPPNKLKPNLDTRFGGNGDGPGNSQPGYFGVSTSSFSSSSDVDGIKKHKEAATTTINDNGKVSSYTVEN